MNWTVKLFSEYFFTSPCIRTRVKNYSDCGGMGFSARALAVLAGLAMLVLILRLKMLRGVLQLGMLTTKADRSGLLFVVHCVHAMSLLEISCEDYKRLCQKVQVRRALISSIIS